MKYSQKDKYVLIDEIVSHGIFAFLKMQIICKFRFIDSSGKPNEEQSIDLINRTINGDNKMIEIIYQKTKRTIDYDTLLKMINETMSEGYVIQVAILKDIFTKNEPLIVLAEDIKQSIINSCVCLTYQDGRFAIINKRFADGTADELYFYEDNNSILAFSKKGPKLIIDNHNLSSIEDVIC